MTVTEPKAPSGWRVLIKPVIVIGLVLILMFVVYPAFADVLAGLGIHLPRL